MGIPHAPKPQREIEEAGGAYVRRRFEFGTREMIAGERLTAAEVASIPLHNLRSLINTGRLELWPAPPGDAPQTFIAERFAINRGFGKWDVVEGRKLNDEVLTKDQAEALAAAGSTQEQQS